MSIRSNIQIHFSRLEARGIAVLRSLERYTKTDMVYLTNGGFWSLFSQVIGSLSSFVVVLLLANILPQGTFGEYRFILSLIPIFTLFTLPAVGTTLIRSVARGNKVSLPEIAKAKTRWSLLGSLAAIIGALYYFHNGNLQLMYAMIVCAFFLPFVETFAIYTSYYKGKQEFKTSAVYESLSRVFQAVVMIAVAFVSTNVLVLLGAFFVGQIIARYFFYKKTVKDISLRPHTGNNALDIKDDTIAYGKDLSLVSILNTVTNNMDVLLVGHFLGPLILAIYYIALAIPKNIVLIFSVVARVAQPKLSQKKWELHERIATVRKIGLMFLGLLILALIYALLIPFVLHIFFRTYGASIHVAIMLSVLIAVSPLNAVIGRILEARKLVRKIVILDLISLGVFSVLFLLMYQTQGAFGAAVSLVGSEITVLVVGILFIK